MSNEIKSFHNDLREQDHSLRTITHPHAHIHDGKAYNAHIDSPILGDGDSFMMYLKTPDTAIRCHTVVEFSGELGGFAEIRESATVSLSGSVVTIFNNDRNSLLTSSVAVRSSPTLTASGTQLTHFHVGGGFQGRDGGNGGDRQEWILKQGTIYIFRYTSIIAANEGDIKAGFYLE